jgi:hypothetical protein
MTRVKIARHNGQLHVLKVRRRLRRKILAAAELGECVLVDADGARLTPEELAEILEGIPLAKVRVIHPREHGVKPGNSPC